MSGLFDAFLTGAILSCLSGLAAWCAAVFAARACGGMAVPVWRAARLVAILPIMIAPAIFLIPQSVPDAAVAEPGHAFAALELPAPLADASTPETPGLPLPGPAQLIAAIYAGGFVLALAIALLRHRRRTRFVSESRLASYEERRAIDGLARRLGVRAPELRVSQAATSPFLTGWRGVVIVPDGFLRSGEQAHYALVHELCHLRRGDERDRLVGAALILLFWFHWPLRRIEHELGVARELACDREALRALGGAERKPYAAALIDMMRSAAQPVSAFGPQDRRHREMRIKAILAGHSTARTRSVLLSAGVLALAVPVAIAQAAVTERRPASAPRAEAPALLQPVSRETAPLVPAVPVASPAPVSAPAPAPAAVSQPTARPAEAPRAAPVPPLPVRIAEGRVTSHYGPRPARPAGSALFHGGTDVAAPRGTAILAPGDGVVTHAQAGFQNSDRWGNTLVLDHGDGWQTIYAHMEGFDVEVGDIVSAGEQIGRVGSTGASTGPHVHVELRHDGERVNPADHLAGLR